MSRIGHREPTENEKEHAYVMHNKREKGETIQGDLGESLDEKGSHGEVKRRRQEWHETHKEGQGGGALPPESEE